MSVLKRIISQTNRVNVGLLVGFDTCRCFHAEIVRDDSNRLPIVHHEKYVCDLPPNHRFPMEKFPRVLHFLLQDQVITEQHTAGGTHHAFPSYGSGFCLLNDLAVAAKYLMSNSSTKRRILIVDLDVHQGDGTAFIFKEEPSVFTFSMHCGKNFPLRKQQSDLDVSVEDGLEDKEYLSTGTLTQTIIITTYMY
uniref:Histone deacetylase domain-containing protein n=1 Tax=Iconisemion striatum TaxID=60296 RepID=A0A1A7XL75_9TELE